MSKIKMVGQSSMAMNYHSSSSNLEQLALKGLNCKQFTACMYDNSDCFSDDNCDSLARITGDGSLPVLSTRTHSRIKLKNAL